MKLFKCIKLTALTAIILGLTVGCASTPEETVQEPQPDDKMEIAEAAIAAAKASLDRAVVAGVTETQGIETTIQQAEAALAAEDSDGAIQLADRALMMIDEAVAGLAKKSTAGMGQYTVINGDNLWTISERGDIYGNPYQWPLIYKANRNRIKDADLIYPGQELDIDRNASDTDINVAVSHARNRGSWSLGTVESSDSAYLAR